MKSKNKILNFVKSSVLFGGKAVVLAVFLFNVQAPASAATSLVGQEGVIIERTNQMRAEIGLAPLKTDSRLMRSAFDKAWDMAARSYFDHGSPEGWRMGYWIGRAGYTYLLAGENLAKGFTSVDRLMQAWADSPLHYKNLVESKFDHIGVGIAQGIYNGKEMVFVVQHFGMEYEPAINTAARVSSGGDVAGVSADVFVEGERANEIELDAPTSPLEVVFAVSDGKDGIATSAAANGQSGSTRGGVKDVIVLLAMITLASMGYVAERLSAKQIFVWVDTSK